MSTSGSGRYSKERVIGLLDKLVGVGDVPTIEAAFAAIGRRVGGLGLSSPFSWTHVTLNQEACNVFQVACQPQPRQVAEAASGPVMFLDPRVFRADHIMICSHYQNALAIQTWQERCTIIASKRVGRSPNHAAFYSVKELPNGIGFWAVTSLELFDLSALA